MNKFGRYQLSKIDKYRGPEKIVEYYIDGMVLIKIANAKLLLNIFENKEAKLFDLRPFEECKKLKRAGRSEELKNGTEFQPKFIQHLVFQSDYAIPKPKKVEKRKNLGAEGTTHESASKTN